MWPELSKLCWIVVVRGAPLSCSQLIKINEKKLKIKKNKICVNGDFVEIGNGATDRFSKNMNLYLVKIKQVFKILLI